MSHVFLEAKQQNKLDTSQLTNEHLGVIEAGLEEHFKKHLSPFNEK